MPRLLTAGAQSRNRLARNRKSMLAVTSPEQRKQTHLYIQECAAGTSSKNSSPSANPGPNSECAMNSGGADNLNLLAKRGMRQLFVRQLITTAVTFVGGAVLARALSPAEFGTYAIATFVVNIFRIC